MGRLNYSTSLQICMYSHITMLEIDRLKLPSVDVFVPWTMLQARLDILKIHSRKMNLTRGINLRKIAEMMPGASGAEVKVGIVVLFSVLYQDCQGIIHKGCPQRHVKGRCVKQNASRRYRGLLANVVLWTSAALQYWQTEKFGRIIPTNCVF